MDLGSLAGLSSPPASGTQGPPAAVIPARITLEPGDPTKKAQTTYAAAVLAKLAYENNANLLRQTLTRLGFKNIRLYGWDLKGSTQAFVARRGDLVVVSFRGTQERDDVLTDLKALDPESDANLTGSRVADFTHYQGAQIHRGFRDGLSELWSPPTRSRAGRRLAAVGQRALLNLLRYEASRQDKPDTKFFITGHSLGGALAILAAASTAVQKATPTSSSTMLDRVAGVVTFGAPKVGNSSFVRAYDAQLAPVTLPVQHYNDLVRDLPFGKDYEHVAEGRTVRLAPANRTSPPSPLGSHRMNYYLERTAAKAAEEIAKNAQTLAVPAGDGFARAL